MKHPADLLVSVADYPNRLFYVVDVRDTKENPLSNRTLRRNPELVRSRFLFTLRDKDTGEVKSVYLREINHESKQKNKSSRTNL